MPSDLQSLVSACYNPQEYEWQVTNRSQYVLDVTSAAGANSSLQVSVYTSTELLPTAAGVLEVEAQNAVVSNQSPDNAAKGEVLLPVGGTVIAARGDLPLTVSVDTDFSMRSHDTEFWANYVVSNVPDESPGNYYQAIADCVNDANELRQEIHQQPPPDPTTLLYQTLKAGLSCNELRKKVQEYLDSRNQPDNLSAEAERAGKHFNEADWESELQKAQVHDEIRIDL